MARLWQRFKMRFTPSPLLKLIQKAKGTSLGKRYRSDAVFRAELSLYTGVALNLLYIAAKLFTGLYFRSVWFMAVAVYYALLAVMRYALLHYMARHSLQTNTAAEYSRYRLCGVVLLFMNQALVGIVVLIVQQNHGYDYPGVLIYGMATYSFYYIIMAIRGFVVFRKHASPVLWATQAIRVVAAMVSMLSLQTAMLTRFGGGAVFRQRMTAATGGVVCATILGLAVFMIVKSTRALKAHAANMQR